VRQRNRVAHATLCTLCSRPSRKRAATLDVRGAAPARRPSQKENFFYTPEYIQDSRLGNQDRELKTCAAQRDSGALLSATGARGELVGRLPKTPTTLQHAAGRLCDARGVCSEGSGVTGVGVSGIRRGEGGGRARLYQHQRTHVPRRRHRPRRRRPGRRLTLCRSRRLEPCASSGGMLAISDEWGGNSSSPLLLRRRVSPTTAQRPRSAGADWPRCKQVCAADGSDGR
jgi:hypothetical protein